MTTDSIQSLAQKAAAQLGWNATFIQNQWALETGNFSSHVWKADNNPAGIKWYPGMTYGTKGTPAADGGYYAKFSDPVIGYVNFVKHNPRYSNVGNSKDPYIEAQTIAKDGWATDPNYAKKVMGVKVSANQVVDVGAGAIPVTQTSFGLPDVPGLISQALGILVGAGLVFLGIWIAMNPFSDLTTAITSTIKQFSKMPLESANNAVKSAPNAVRQRSQQKQVKKNDELKNRKENKALDREMKLLQKHIKKLDKKNIG